ncbi:MAG: hypothetical protein RIS28_1335 [Bacteroidota bacterium]
MRDESNAFLEKYLNNVSPTGFEHSGQSIWLDYLEMVDLIFRLPLRCDATFTAKMEIS